ncbi:MAG: nitrogen regulation protein NR(II) [Acidiferrobacterales bacterium]
MAQKLMPGPPARGLQAEMVATPMLTLAAECILDNLATAVLIFDRRLRLVFMNPAGEMLFEVSAGKVVGRTVGELLPKSRRLVRALQHTLTRGSPFTARGVPLALPGTQRITVDCTVSKLSDDPGAGELLVELTQVDRLLRLANEQQMLQSQTANRAMIEGLAHEIKNPLGGLRGAAQLLERELPNGSLKDYTGIIMEEADRLRALVDRMVGPNQPLARVPTNLHQILEHVRNLILAEHAPGIHIERIYDPSLPDLRADPDQLIQAVLNVVRNAVEAMNARGRISLRTGVERRFTIGQKSHRLVLRADIEDEGPGIAPELLDRIFYPMVTGKAQGSGLGLSIANDIISKHGGLIECNSQPGKTVFSIYLPLENANG